MKAELTRLWVQARPKQTMKPPHLNKKRLMTDNRQHAYLDAMGIDVWSLRQSDAALSQEACSAPLIKLGPGDGGVLLVCSNDADSASRLANDIGRALGAMPVWAWPLAESDGVQLEAAVDEHLFTTVAIFGEQLASQFFGEQLPVNLNAANLVLLPSMNDVRQHPSARQMLWARFCQSGMVVAN